MRTNIDIDDKLMAEAMAATDSPTKKAVVEQGLQLLVQIKAQEGLRRLRGRVVWRGHDDDWFASDEEILKRRKLTGRKTVSKAASAFQGKPARASAGRQR